MSSWIGLESQLWQLMGKPSRSVLQDLAQAKASKAGNVKRWKPSTPSQPPKSSKPDPYYVSK